jgi:hypothetical protein
MRSTTGYPRFRGPRSGRYCQQLIRGQDAQPHHHRYPEEEKPMPSGRRQAGGRQFSLVRGLRMGWEYDQEPMSKRAVAIEVF